MSQQKIDILPSLKAWGGCQRFVIVYRSHALRGNAFGTLCVPSTRDAERLKRRSYAERRNDATCPTRLMVGNAHPTEPSRCCCFRSPAIGSVCGVPVQTPSREF